MSTLKYKTKYGKVRISRKFVGDNYNYIVSIKYHSGDNHYNYYNSMGDYNDRWESRFKVICNLLERDDTNAEAINEILPKR